MNIAALVPTSTCGCQLAAKTAQVQLRLQLSNITVFPGSTLASSIISSPMILPPLARSDHPRLDPITLGQANSNVNVTTHKQLLSTLQPCPLEQLHLTATSKPETPNKGTPRQPPTTLQGSSLESLHALVATATGPSGNNSRSDCEPQAPPLTSLIGPPTRLSTHMSLSKFINASAHHVLDNMPHRDLVFATLQLKAPPPTSHWPLQPLPALNQHHHTVSSLLLKHFVTNIATGQHRSAQRPITISIIADSLPTTSSLRHRSLLQRSLPRHRPPLPTTTATRSSYCHPLRSQISPPDHDACSRACRSTTASPSLGRRAPSWQQHRHTLSNCS